ncbi:MAG: hypothetical protein HFJ48_01575 [Clostridia bacterium]|nr:hypothetical protein [Clostridia bacterium]
MKIEDLLQKIMLKVCRIARYTENYAELKFCTDINVIELKATKKNLEQFKRFNFQKTIDLDDETAIDDLQEAVSFLEKLEGSEKNND